SELLNEEEHAVNWYMANQQIVPYIPEDSVFLTGSKAPFYKMDDDGYVYMQIINQGDMQNRPKKGETVYFRYKYQNIKDLAAGTDAKWYGNADKLQENSMSFVYGNTVLTSTTRYGEGIQVPLDFVGYDSEVNVVIKSPKGPVEDQTLCLPFVYNIKYFKAEY
ncbi:MAG: DUF4827 domain-containing protein, partial [Muribaculaceae bacterium]|nr:DUF4827 domain-containing protein [Muribaculaceae bacterium]